MKLEFDKMSRARKMIITAAGILYGLAILGNARFGDFHMMVAVSLFFVVITSIILLWVK